jgi:hypothetical protein
MSELIHTFLIYHYGGLLHEKSLSPIDDVYRLTSSEILKPTNNIILVWISKLTLINYSTGTPNYRAKYYDKFLKNKLAL